MLAQASTAALLTLASSAVVLAYASTAALLTLSSYAVVLAYASTAALLTLASLTVVLAQVTLTGYFVATAHSCSMLLLFLVVAVRAIHAAAVLGGCRPRHQFLPLSKVPVQQCGPHFKKKIVEPE